MGTILFANGIHYELYFTDISIDNNNKLLITFTHVNWIEFIFKNSINNNRNGIEIQTEFNIWIFWWSIDQSTYKIWKYVIKITYYPISIAITTSDTVLVSNLGQLHIPYSTTATDNTTTKFYILIKQQ